MSGLCIASARAAKIKYGANVFIERGSRHILSQKEILESIQRNSEKRKPVPDYAVARELASYALADVIAVPSLHAEQSFLEYGMPKSKLFRNPYGVDLSMFPPTPAPPSEPPTILFVGNWSYRKGCDVLTQAWRMLKGTRLIHVGSRGDAPMPDDSDFMHIGPVPQWKLWEYYAQAQVFVLPSREDGFGLVLSQALACGLPVVYTDRTGGEDLAELAGTNQGFFIVPHGKVEPLTDGIRSAMLWAKSRCPTGAIRNVVGESRASLSWETYGKRYSNRLMKLDLPKML
jgi:glycosyltransferase involved in cell wall biosynthesis